MAGEGLYRRCVGDATHHGKIDEMAVTLYWSVDVIHGHKRFDSWENCQSCRGGASRAPIELAQDPGWFTVMVLKVEHR